MENHFIEIENRKKITITEVNAVESFDEETIIAELAEEGLIINGSSLHIEVLDLEEGKLIATGNLDNIAYVKKANRENIFSRFKRK